MAPDEPHVILNLGIPVMQYPQEHVDSCSGKLIVVGGARCVWEDLAKLGVKPDFHNGGYDVMTVNDITMHYPGRIRHVYSNDRRWLPKWVAARRELHVRKFGPHELTHSCRKGGEVTWPWPGHGTSALNAVYTGLALGYDQIVLCGVPLDDSGHYFDSPWTKTNFQQEVCTKENGELTYWSNANAKVFMDKVRSVSGRTRDLLGAP